MERTMNMDFKTERIENGLRIQHGPLRLDVDSSLALRPALACGEKHLSPVTAETPLAPSFGIQLEGLPVTAFRADWERLEVREVSNSLGAGRKVAVYASAVQYGNALYQPLEISVRLELEFYERFPSALIGSAEFTNLGKRTYKIDRLTGSHYRLDRRLLDPAAAPWAFASYQGAAYRWGTDYEVVWLDSRFSRRNFMGVGELTGEGGEGGGTPLVDLWCPETGLAVGSAEPRPEWISLPVNTCRDGLVELSVEEVPEARLGQKTSLAPGESVRGIRSLTILHSLDFHDALRTYADILRSQGVAIPLTSPAACHEPYWKSWGFGLDFTQEQIFGAVTDLKEFGIRTALLDDGWFVHYGDWEPHPAPGKFPGGEKDLREFVRRMQAEGIKIGLWWYPQGVSPDSRLAAEHPEWLIRREDGSFPACQRGLYYLCADCPQAVEYVRGLTVKIMSDWGFDSLYLDTTGLSAAPPCFNPDHGHSSPLDSYRNQYKLFRAVFETAQEIKSGCMIEMCICGIPHDPFKMPYYNLANASDPVNLLQVRRRIKVEKAFRGPSFAVGDCYQIPMHEWEGWSCPESFESALGTGAQATTLYSRLTDAQRADWRSWFGLYRKLDLSRGEYLNLYDLAWDKPEAHVVKKGERLYYGFFAERWSRATPLTLRGLEPGRAYRVRDYADERDLGVITSAKPLLPVAFKDSLLLELTPES